jgi:hypothetical protein
MHVFAASRYRLYVNGQVVGHGPARYVPGHEWYDTYDLSSHLRAGENTVVIESCWINVNHFQSMPDDRPRCIAWGEVRGASAVPIDLVTPGQWQAKASAAHCAGTPPFSFAIGPLEVLDVQAHELERGGDGGWFSPMTLEEPLSPEPRDLPMPSGEELDFQCILAGTVKRDETRIGFVSVHPTQGGGHHAPTQGDSFRYATFLHSPSDQAVTLGLHWGPHFLNGREICGQNDPLHGNRQNAEVSLKAGWNLLCGEPQQVTQATPLLIGWPSETGITAHASPNRETASPMRYQTPKPIESDQRWADDPPSTLEQLEAEGEAWHEVAAEDDPPCPARIMSWDRIDQNLQTPPHFPMGAKQFQPTTFVFDHQAEYLGHVLLTVDAPEGTIIDLGYDERLRDDGVIDYFATNPFTETADRFVCREGRQTIETFLPRGGRYLQITVRPTSTSDQPIELIDLKVLDARCLVEYPKERDFGDPLFNWLWRTGVHTMESNTEDVFCDCPWRERGLYLGDSYVQSAVHFCLSEDTRIVKRSLRLFAQGQREDGQLPCVVPAWLRYPHSDFSLIFTLWLHDAWKVTGDDALAEELLPAADRVLDSETWITSTNSSLWDPTEENRVFIDWGVRKAARTYPENAVVNAFRYQALRCSAEMHQALGHSQEAKQRTAQADRVAEDYRQRLWQDDLGRFAAGIENGKPVEAQVFHGNVLALTFGLADADQEPRLIEHVLDRLSRNAEHAKQGKQNGDFLELYFLRYALDAMVRIGRHDVARQIIRDHYTPIMEADSPTIWECLHRGYFDRGSLCHSWSAAPLMYLARHGAEA